MKIALVGSRRIVITKKIAERIDQLLDALDQGDTLLLRSPDGVRASSPFEATAAILAADHDLNVRYVTPDAPERAATYRRDYTLVEAADEVLAYFPDQSELGGGTWHVTHAAMQKGIPCRAFTITQDGRQRLIGSEDGESMFVDADVYAFV